MSFCSQSTTESFFIADTLELHTQAEVFIRIDGNRCRIGRSDRPNYFYRATILSEKLRLIVIPQDGKWAAVELSVAGATPNRPTTPSRNWTSAAHGPTTDSEGRSRS
jgi:hypothetical protein